jgi:hypothetical protein
MCSSGCLLQVLYGRQLALVRDVIGIGACILHMRLRMKENMGVVYHGYLTVCLAATCAEQLVARASALAAAPTGANAVVTCLTGYASGSVFSFTVSCRGTAVGTSAWSGLPACTGLQALPM